MLILLRAVPTGGLISSHGAKQHSLPARARPHFYSSSCWYFVSMADKETGTVRVAQESEVSRLLRLDTTPWYKKPNLRSLYFCLVPAVLGVEMTSGYDGSILNGLQAVQPWLNCMFKLPNIWRSWLANMHGANRFRQPSRSCAGSPQCRLQHWRSHRPSRGSLCEYMASPSSGPGVLSFLNH